VSYDITIYGQVILDPCTVVLMAANTKITIAAGGALYAMGASGSPVTIDAKVARANWDSIKNYGVLSLNHAIVRFGGKAVSIGATYTGALQMLNNTGVGLFHVDDVEVSLSASQGVYIASDIGFDPTSQNLRVMGSTGYPVNVVPRVIGTIPTGDYSQNTFNEIAIGGGGAVSSDQTIHNRGVPYHVGSGAGGARLDVNSGVSNMVAVLTIEPGVQMQFPPGGTLNIDPSGGTSAVYKPAQGALIAIGTARQPIVFTSDRGKASAPGDWLGIGFGGSVDPRTILQHVSVVYAGGATVTGSNSCPYNGRTGQNYAAIRIFGPAQNAFITYTDILYSARDGIDRGWRDDLRTDFLPNKNYDTFNTFTAVAECFQTTPAMSNNQCPADPPCR
jgi:hypothetical protein